MIELQLHITSAKVTAQAESNFVQIDGFDFRCRSRLLVGKTVADTQDAAADAWAKLLHVQRAENFRANDKTARQFKWDLLTLQ